MSVSDGHDSTAVPLYARPAVVVGCALLVLTIAALGYVAAYGRNVPSWDDWDMVPTSVGVQPVTWEWLWSQHNEHRNPIPRLAWLALYRGFHDFRAAMVTNVLVLAGISIWMLAALRRVTGCWRWTDVFLPIVALHLGQGLNFMWGCQLEFVLSTAFAVGWLVTLASRSEVGPRAIVTTGAFMVLLTGSGANGLALVPSMIAWVMGVAWFAWPSVRLAGSASGEAAGSIGRDDPGVRVANSPRLESPLRKRWDASPSLPLVGICASVAVLGVVVILVYLRGYERVPHHPTSPTWWVSVTTAAKALTMSFGGAVRAAWPVSAGVVILILLATAGQLLHVLRRRPAERARAWGLLCFVFAIGSLAAALGSGRDGFEARYVTLLFPLLWGIYVVWRLYAPDGVGRWIRVALTCAAIAAWWPNTRDGIEYGRDVSRHLDQFASEIVDGRPPSALIARHGAYLHPTHELLTDYLPLLRGARWGAFAHLKDDPTFERVDVRPESWTVTDGQRENRRLRYSPKTRLMFRAPVGRTVAGIELTYAAASGKRQPLVRLDWRTATRDYDNVNWYHWTPTGDRGNWDRRSYLRVKSAAPARLCWIWEDVTEFRLTPDYRSGELTIERIVLLLVP